MSVGGTGTRVRRQKVPVTDRTVGDRAPTAPLRDPGQDLVSEQARQVETSQGGWRVAPPPPPLLRPFQPQVRPRVTWYGQTGSGRGRK